MNSPGQQVPNMLLQISGEITPERMKRRSQSKNNTQLPMGLVMEARSDAVKNNIAQESGMLGPQIKANWKWSNKSECQHFRNGLEWVNLTQMTIISTTVARIPQKKWSNHHSQQQSPKCSTWMQSQNDRMISVHFQGEPFNITVIQVYAPTSNAEEAEVEQFYEDRQDLLELTPQIDVLFIIGD